MKGRLALGGLAVIGALALAAGAYAYFTSTGSGSNNGVTVASPGDNQLTVSVNQSGTPNLSVPLFPALTTDSNFSSLYQPYSGTVTNTTSGHEEVTTLTATIESVTPTTGNTCDKSNFSLYSPAHGWTVATGGQSATTNSNNTATSASLPDDMSGSGTTGGSFTYNDIAVYLVDNPSSNQNGCQGATVNITVAAS